MTKKKVPSAMAGVREALLRDAPLNASDSGVTAARAFLRGEGDGTAFATVDAGTLSALVDLLVDRGAIDRLHALESTGAPHVARAAGRGLHILRTRGVALPARKAISTTWRAAAEPLPNARIGLDFMYDVQWLTLFRRDDAGDGVAVIATIDGEGALRTIDAIHTSRGRYRALATAAVPRDSFSMEVDADDAYRRLLEAVATRESLGRPHLDTATVLKKLTPPTNTPALPSSNAQPAPPFERDELAEFAKRPVLRTWVPEEAVLRAFTEGIKEAQTSLVAIDKRQIAEQIQTVVARLASTYFTEQRRKTHARRFDDLAHEFAQRSDPEGHRVARALAHALRTDGVDPTAHPYTLWFFGRFVPAITAEHPARIARGTDFDEDGADDLDAFEEDTSVDSRSATGRIILP